MTHFRRRHAAPFLPLIAAMLASSGTVLAQDQLPIPPLPADDVVVENAFLSGAAAIESFNADEMADNDRDDLLRGPVHEAFAEQVNSDPTPNMIVTLQPPEPVEELPPELKPDGLEVEWISGYWAWDEDHEDFIWISGVWREIPQGFRWLPGYWTEVEGGFQWVSGTWVSTQTTEIQYLVDAPPETLELGSVGIAPTSDHIWIPGTWMWNETRYAWRPGYWSAGYANWVWVPARYQCTPRGYYYCGGYWDYPVNRRGVLFAPSYFNRRFRSHRITGFTPRVVISTNLLTTHFWVRPRCRHYYFGNYYNVAYSNRGLVPWYQYPQQRRTFDPLYAYYSRGQRSNAFRNQQSVQFNLFVNQPNRRPAITFRDQDRWVHEGHGAVRSTDLLGNRFQNLVDNSARDRNGLQFVRMENRQREVVQQDTRQLRDLGNQRRDVERSLTQLQKSRDGNQKSHSDGHDANRTDLRERLDRNVESPVSNNHDLKSARVGHAGANGNHGAVHSPGSKTGNTKDARTTSGGRDVNNDGTASDLNGRGTVADSLRLEPRVDTSKGGGLRDQIEKTARDASKKPGEISNRLGQTADTVKEQTAGSVQNATARRIERDGSQERLKLPPMTRSVDAKSSAGVSDSGKPSDANHSARDLTNRTESRAKSANEGPVRNTLHNGSAIRNSVQGRDRTPATGETAANPPAIKRASTPGTTPATRPAPTIRSTPQPQPVPAQRSTPAPKLETGRAIRNQGGGGSTRSAPSVNPPALKRASTPAAAPAARPAPTVRSTPSINPSRGDTAARVRSTPAPAASPARKTGGAGGASGAGAGAAAKKGRGK